MAAAGQRKKPEDLFNKLDVISLGTLDSWQPICHKVPPFAIYEVGFVVRIVGTGKISIETTTVVVPAQFIF